MYTYKKKLSKRNKRILFIVFFLLAIILVILGVRIFGSIRQKPQQPAQEAHDYSPELAAVLAKSFYVYDMSEKKVLFAKNEHEELPLASITKLMSGLIISTTLPATSTVTVTENDLIRGEDTNGLFAGEKWEAENLLNFSLIMSSNTGIYALSDALNSYLGGNGSTTIDLMNQKARELGLTDTIFFNESGLDLNATTSGAYSSAYDVSLLLDKILTAYPQLISKTTESAEDFISESNIRHLAINTDTLVDKIPGLIASKTGYTDLAGGNLAIAFDAGIEHPVIIVVLGSTEDGRFSDMEQLVHVTFEKLSK